MNTVNIAVGTPAESAFVTLLVATLEYTKWDKPRAAKILRVSLSTVYARIRKHRLKPDAAARRRVRR